MEDSNSPTSNRSKPSRYEESAMQQWGDFPKPAPPVPTLPSKAGKLLGKSLQKFNKILHDKFPELDKFAEKALAPITKILGQAHPADLVTRAVRAYQQAGYPVQTPDDISGLDLQDVEKVVGNLCQHYRQLALQEETEAALSDADATSDIVALVNLNHQAINELATYFGFDISNHEERLFALTLLEYAATTDEGARFVVFKRLVNNVRNIALKSKEGRLDKGKFMDLFSGMAKAVSIHLVKAKVGQSLPIHGAVIGTGFNAYFTTEVCDVASFFYKQKFLARKYGDRYLDTSQMEEEE